MTSLHVRRSMRTQLHVGPKPSPSTMRDVYNEPLAMRLKPLGKPIHLDDHGNPLPNQDGTIAFLVGGFWTSTWIRRRRTSAWVEYGLVGESEPWWLLSVQPCRVIEIASVSDFAALVEAYSLPSRSSLSRIEALVGRPLDWEAMKRDGYDGLHLTQTASRILCSFRFDAPIGTPAMGFSSWDTESTCWFRWKFRNVEPAPKPEAKPSLEATP